PSVPLELAALVGCALSTGLGAVWRTAQVHPGSSVAVIGCGGVGLSVIQGARLAGAGTIVAVDPVPSKLEMAKRFGATVLLDAAGDVLAGVRQATGGRGADTVFEVVGRSSTIEQAFAATRRGGTTVLVGAGFPGDRVSFDAMELFLSSKTIRGCVYGSTDPDRDFPVLVDLIRSGAVDASGLVTNRIPLDQVNEAFESMEAGTVARSVIVFDQ
ncbi:MAG TPA: zinc-binding dehydrogenase, partial [Acidimicrobiales bacterium]|nr:zinc-binding dehydrogenase [Acidimicrobiales bacterium]